VAKKLRKSGTGSADVTVTPTGTGRLLYVDASDAIEVWRPSGVEGPDTIYVLSHREPKAVGVTYAAARHGD
jgi:hypothetical protein